jgi:hypothetical protein
VRLRQGPRAEYKQRLDILEALPAPGGAAAAEGGGGATPMDTDDGTIGAQTLGMLPGEEALAEAGDTEGQTKMVRITGAGGQPVAAVFKWSSKAAKWEKHKEVVDQDQPADAEGAFFASPSRSAAGLCHRTADSTAVRFSSPAGICG